MKKHESMAIGPSAVRAGVRELPLPPPEVQVENEVMTVMTVVSAGVGVSLMAQVVAQVMAQVMAHGSKGVSLFS